jgi:vancomycin resistance protein VanJ
MFGLNLSNPNLTFIFGRFASERILSILRAALVGLLAGCRSARRPEPAAGPHFTILTYNVNWGAPRPDLAAEIIGRSGADIVCLQETTAAWERYLRAHLSREYPFMEFRESKARKGGGLAFLSKLAGSEIAYVPSETDWFDGWLRAFNTEVGTVQVLNVHLRPPVGKRGAWTPSGYLFTGKERLQEMQRFYAARRSELRTVIAGDFNDVENGAPVKWLKHQGMSDALSEFDRSSPTWEWRVGPITLHRRMDHILYSAGLNCSASAVTLAGASDHFPVMASFEIRQ